MANVKTFSEKQILSDKKIASVGLSYSNQSHRNFIQISRNLLTGETKIQPKTISLITKRTEWRDGGRNGKLFLEGLTNKGKAKIQKASRVLEQVHKIEHELKAYTSLITLTYGKDFPTDHDSKKHLDTFLKRLRRLHDNCKYVWVAEKQKRGAIHYHILTPYFTKKEFVNSAWNEIVSKWQIKNGHEQQTLLPNVIKVNSAGSYMAKYLSKEGQNIGGNGYGIDQKTRVLMIDKTFNLIQHDRTPEQINEIVNAIVSKVQKTDTKKFIWKSNYTTYKGCWLREIDMFKLGEFFKYDRHEFNLITERELLENKIERFEIENEIY